MGSYSLKHSIENCGQTAADGDMVAIVSLYGKWPAPYPTAPLLTPYHLPFNHGTARLVAL